jgi:hypothetical protein
MPATVKPDAMPYDHSIVIVKNDNRGYELLYFNRLMGCSKIGVRLGRGEGIPDLPTKSPTRSGAEQLREKWQAWVDQTNIITRRKGSRS